jgi:hypothetical protein
MRTDEGLADGCASLNHDYGMLCLRARALAPRVLENFNSWLVEELEPLMEGHTIDREQIYVSVIGDGGLVRKIVSTGMPTNYRGIFSISIGRVLDSGGTPVNEFVACNVVREKVKSYSSVYDGVTVVDSFHSPK